MILTDKPYGEEVLDKYLRLAGKGLASPTLTAAAERE
jgi:hypothetical protein